MCEFPRSKARRFTPILVRPLRVLFRKSFAYCHVMPRRETLGPIVHEVCQPYDSSSGRASRFVPIESHFAPSLDASSYNFLIANATLGGCGVALVIRCNFHMPVVTYSLLLIYVYRRLFSHISQSLSSSGEECI